MPSAHDHAPCAYAPSVPCAFTSDARRSSRSEAPRPARTRRPPCSRSCSIEAAKGVEKDEAVEVIWPEASLTVADTAFHRTLLGLRGSLRAGGFGDAVEFRNGRYVLASGLVSWSDTWELEGLIDASATTTDVRDRIQLLESCRQLNRADYMDDCPFFGTSVYVEARRSLLRAVRQAVLVELAEVYGASGHHALSTIRAAEADGMGDPADRV